MKERSRLIEAKKTTGIGGDIIEIVIWEIVSNAGRVVGVRYRLAFVPSGNERPAVLYDNHRPKGHHRHVDGREEPYSFSTAESLREDFKRDVERWKAGELQR